MKASAVIGNILFVVAIAAAGWFVFKPTDPGAKDPEMAQMKTPRGALMVYLRHADGFKSQRSNFYDIEKCIVPEDWTWFQSNHEALFAERDTHNIAGGIAPTDAVVAGRLVVMSDLLEAGPHGTGSLIIKEEVSGNHAEFIVRKKEVLGTGRDMDVYYNCKVHLVKVDDFWRVKDFAGGRAVIEGRGADVITEIPQEQGRLDEKRAAEGLPLDGSTPDVAASAPPPQDPSAASAVPSSGGFEPPSAPAEQAAAPGGFSPPPVGGNPGGGFEPPPTSGGFDPPPASGGFEPPANAAATGGFEQPAAVPSSEPPPPPPAADPLVQADNHLVEAASFWKQRRFNEALRAAEAARTIRLQRLGPTDPKVLEVDRMIARAKDKLAGR